ncbi:MAG: ATP-dependent DNA helicase DinG [Pseudomonadota bacterium]
MLTEELKADIQSSYRQFLAKRSLKSRHGQKLMIAEVANTLANIATDASGERLQQQALPHICVIEAGTGTGKTVAYLLATLPIAKALNKKLVIATATVALQEQIINKDLPELKNNTDLAFNFTLAKGRGRYLCLSKLDRLLDNTNPQLSMEQSLYEQAMPLVDETAMASYQQMIEAMATGQWNGDRDTWDTELAASVWAPVSTTHRECTGRRCSNISNCSFFKARESIDTYDCIVANHDLVLADLALGGGAILPAPSETIYIFDEGHHLADKALSHFSYHTRVASTGKWLEQSHKTLSSLAAAIGAAGQVDHYAEQLQTPLVEAKQQLELLYPLCQQLLDQHALQQTENRFKAETKRHRFESGVPPQSVLDIAEQLATHFDRITSLLAHMTTEIQQAIEDSFCPVPKVDLEAWFPLVGNWHARAEANLSLWRSYHNSGHDSSKAEDQQAGDTPPFVPVARWISLVEFSGAVDFEICSSPILAANTLRHRLWEQCYGAVVTSATLTALGKFDRFKMRSGTSDQQHYSIMPSPFDFTQALLQVPHYAVEANQVNDHTQHLVEHLPGLCEEFKGSLVLFASRRQMEEVYYQLPGDLREQVIMQGELSKQKMLTQHKNDIDNKQQSILFGLASFAEGVDLPGDYCRHVIIAKLPFSVPADPIEAALAEWIEQQGGNAFMDIAVPDAAMRLVQACGRLLRTESDSGKITILDKRLVTKRYGKLLLNCLPGYRLALS